jgi:hypothetical protein
VEAYTSTIRYTHRSILSSLLLGETPKLSFNERPMNPWFVACSEALDCVADGPLIPFHQPNSSSADFRVGGLCA